MKNGKYAAAIVASVALSLTQLPGVTFTQNFSQDPLTHGWNVVGDGSLFHWNSTNETLEVTWDSGRSNSYFYKPLGTILARDDDFRVEFDLRLNDIGPSADANKPYSFPIALGFLNLGEATQTNFVRGTGYNSPDLVELAYFYDDGSFYGTTTVWPVLVDSTSAFNYNSSSDSAIYALSGGEWFHVAMIYTPADQRMVTTVTNVTLNSGITIIDPLDSSFTDFRADAISISSYSDAGQVPDYAGSVLAHGVVDNLEVTVPEPPVQKVSGVVSNGVWQVHFDCRTHWNYTLERTTNFDSWSAVGTATPATSSSLTLSDTNSALAAKAFYRVRANRP